MQWSPSFLAPGTGFAEDNFSVGQWGERGGRWFQDDLNLLLLLCTLFLLLLHELTSDHQALDLGSWGPLFICVSTVFDDV